MKKYIYILLAAATLFTGCKKDFLTEEPFLTESNALTLSDFDGISNAVLGAYAPLADGSWYGADWVLNSEMRAENASRPINPDFTSGRYTLPFDMSYSADATVGIWGTAYYVISAANNVLEQIEVVGDDYYLKGGVTQQDLDNIKAECLFLRALAHFDIARTYAYSPAKAAVVGFDDCVPIILRTDKTAQDQPARDKVADVFAQIEKDLTEAESLMSWPAFISTTRNGRMLLTKPRRSSTTPTTNFGRLMNIPPFGVSKSVAAK